MAKPYPKKGMPPKKEPKPLNKLTPKQRAKINLNQEYYQKAIEANERTNGGKCVCENCPGNSPTKVIRNPSGRNVSHIVSAGANAALYHDMLNHFILCDNCEAIWTDFDPTTMFIWAESQERKTSLTRKYYEKANQPKSIAVLPPKERALAIIKTHLTAIAEESMDGDAAMARIAQQCALVDVSNTLEALTALPYGIGYLKIRDYYLEIAEEIEEASVGNVLQLPEGGDYDAQILNIKTNV